MRCELVESGEGPLLEGLERSVAYLAALAAAESLSFVVGIVNDDTSHLGDRFTDISWLRLAGACRSDSTQKV